MKNLTIEQQIKLMREALERKLAATGPGAERDRIVAALARLEQVAAETV